eukprot:scaffold14091_cov121-Isochrysis_galbana.AAC.9
MVKIETHPLVPTFTHPTPPVALDFFPQIHGQTIKVTAGAPAPGRCSPARWRAGAGAAGALTPPTAALGYTLYRSIEPPLETCTGATLRVDPPPSPYPRKAAQADSQDGR